jgi:hypothetical protein
MDEINVHKPLGEVELECALVALAFRLKENGAGPYHVVVCGGSALILTGAIPRTTKDVDVVALLEEGRLTSPQPLPDDLIQAVREVAADEGLMEDWLNNGPSKDPQMGLFQGGLPDGFGNRLSRRDFGEQLSVFFIGRIDQIFFKLYASVDRGGYHVEDLHALNPSAKELIAAVEWARSHDPSGGFLLMVRSMLEQIGYADAAERI